MREWQFYVDNTNLWRKLALNYDNSRCFIQKLLVIARQIMFDTIVWGVDD